MMKAIVKVDARSFGRPEEARGEEPASASSRTFIQKALQSEPWRKNALLEKSRKVKMT